ncbi:MAG: hypothetical protein K0R17_3095 [Rariglobus sp.]|jgi:hypothetical protein|nr:hypothetical protein [Rariglobus sp.]
MTVSTPATQNPPASAGVAAWRILFRMLAGFFALFSFAFWAAAGWNQGRTQTVQVPVKQAGGFTGSELVTYKDHFMPGVELLGACLFLSVALFAITFLRARPVHSPSSFSHTS